MSLLTGKPRHGLAKQAVLKRIAVLRSQGTRRWDNIPDPGNRGLELGDYTESEGVTTNGMAKHGKGFAR